MANHLINLNKQLMRSKLNKAYIMGNNFYHIVLKNITYSQDLLEENIVNELVNIFGDNKLKPGIVEMNINLFTFGHSKLMLKTLLENKNMISFKFYNLEIKLNETFDSDKILMLIEKLNLDSSFELSFRDSGFELSINSHMFIQKLLSFDEYDITKAFDDTSEFFQNIKLQSLRFSFNNTNTQVYPIFLKFLNDLHDIEKLVIIKCEYTENDLIQLINKYENIKYLGIKKNGNTLSKKFFDCIKDTKKVTSLCINDTHIINSDLCDFIKTYDLMELHVSSNKSKEDMYDIFLAVQSNNVIEIFKIDDKIVDYYCGSIEMYDTYIESLTSAHVKLLINHPSLKRLVLWNTSMIRINCEIDPNMPEVIGELIKSKKLESLEFGLYPTINCECFPNNDYCKCYENIDKMNECICYDCCDLTIKDFKFVEEIINQVKMALEIHPTLKFSKYNHHLSVSSNLNTMMPREDVI